MFKWLEFNDEDVEQRYNERYYERLVNDNTFPAVQFIISLLAIVFFRWFLELQKVTKGIMQANAVMEPALAPPTAPAPRRSARLAAKKLF